ncbi:MAG: ribulose-phosphate 3-epimerase, partial [Firmicutes bacterium]|nr:ribulose-phosphate 3-epimerase [Bacillota bacterium]
LSALKKEMGYDYIIEIDGGIGISNIERVEASGVEMAVAGSSVFKADDPAEAVRMLKEK